MPDATPFSNEELAKFIGKFKHDSPCECARCRFLATLDAANKRIAELERHNAPRYVTGTWICPVCETSAAKSGCLCYECAGKRIAELDKWRLAVENLTPGGSEYHNDLEQCLNAINYKIYDGPQAFRKVLFDKLERANKRIAEVEAEIDRQYGVIHGMHGEYQQIWLEKDKRIAELTRLLAAYRLRDAGVLEGVPDVYTEACKILDEIDPADDWPIIEELLAIARAETPNAGGEEK